MFDEKTIRALGSYVYCLIDPRNGQAFYIGKGERNRVFDHVREAKDEEKETGKLNIIREIELDNRVVEHVIIKHGLSSDEAHIVEGALIDFAKHFDIGLSNVVLGRESIVTGIMTTDEIKRKYEAEPLEKIGEDCVVININRKYKRAKNATTIYELAKESWAIRDKRIGPPKDPILKYVLVEYRGFIVEVFKVNHWYKTSDDKGRDRWAFEGTVAPSCVRDLYINRSIKKKRGAANPITYNL